MREKVDQLFKSKLDAVQIAPSASVKAGVVKSVSAIILKNTIVAVVVGVSATSTAVVTAKLVYDEYSNSQNGNAAKNQLILNEVLAESENTISFERAHELYTINEVQDNSTDLNNDASNPLTALNTNKTSLENHHLSHSNQAIAKTNLALNKLRVDSRSHIVNEAIIENNTNFTSLEHEPAESNSSSNGDLANPFEDEYSLLLKDADPITMGKSSFSNASSADHSDLEKTQIQNKISDLQKEIEHLENNSSLASSGPILNGKRSVNSASSLNVDFGAPSLDVMASHQAVLPSFLVTNGQSLLGQKVSLNKNSGLLFGLKIGVQYSVADLSPKNGSNANLESQTAYDSKHLQTLMTAAGLTIAKDFGKLEVTSGVSLTSFTSEQELITNSSSVENLGSMQDVYATTIIGGEMFTELIGQEFVDSLVTTYSSEKTENTQQISYISIPLRMDYDLVYAGGFSSGLSLGMNYNLLSKAKGSVLNNEGSELVNLDKTTLNQHLFHARLGVFLSQRMTKRISLNLNPNFIFTLNNQFNKNYNHFDSFSGLEVQAGLSIRL